jgi:hypothetical protein
MDAVAEAAGREGIRLAAAAADVVRRKSRRDGSVEREHTLGVKEVAASSSSIGRRPSRKNPANMGDGLM